MKDEGKSAGMAEVFRFVQAAAGVCASRKRWTGLNFGLALHKI
jgi:hypothetical protein